MSGKSYGQRDLAGYSAWNHKESDTNELIFTLFNKLLQTPAVEDDKYLLPHPCSEGQDSGNGLVGPFWLKVSCEVMARLQSSEDLSKARTSLSRLLVGGLGITVWASSWAAQDLATGFPWSDDGSGRERGSVSLKRRVFSTVTA